jgi:hypothetical protein
MTSNSILPITNQILGESKNPVAVITCLGLAAIYVDILIDDDEGLSAEDALDLVLTVADDHIQDFPLSTQTRYDVEGTYKTGKDRLQSNDFYKYLRSMVISGGPGQITDYKSFSEFMKKDAPQANPNRDN